MRVTVGNKPTTWNTDLCAQVARWLAESSHCYQLKDNRSVLGTKEKRRACLSGQTRLLVKGGPSGMKEPRKVGIRLISVATKILLSATNICELPR